MITTLLISNPRKLNGIQVKHLFSIIRSKAL